ncbi:MAG: hypothetical protein IKX84_02065 [Clostridia bacterium]|nr:hypothetical protein [Clostridia bacterium]
MSRSLRIISVLTLIALILCLWALADDDAPFRPRAYTFTEEELAALREQIAGGDTEQALAALDGRLDGSAVRYIINPRTGKYHTPYCRNLSDITCPVGFTGDRQELDDAGFKACKACRP